MSDGQTVLSRGRANVVLATLFVGSFVLGSAELLMVGVLNLIADDLDVSIPTAGTLVTAYALGVAIGGPLLTALTIRFDKRLILLGSALLFALGNLVPVLTGSFVPFVVVRAVTGSLHGLFVAVAFLVAMAVVPPDRAGRAISVVFSGFAVSAAAGVPLGTLVGQALSWRDSFVAIVVLCALVCAVVAATVPSLPATGEAGAGDQARHAFAPRVLAVLGLGLLMFASLYSALTYIVPFLEGVTGVTGALLSVFLLAYGVSTAVGSFGGGRFADSGGAPRAMLVGCVGATASMVVLLVGGSIAAVVILALLVWGMFALGAVPAFQYRVLELAGPGSRLASSLPASAANAGIALGSVIGGAAIGAAGGSGVSSAVVAGIVVGVITIPIAWATGFLRRPAADGAAEPAPAA
ncbi:MFS transporter [Saccharothrix syringae]|uniref:MFS transporter n=1 Tax=Saccharothrix syringae TaxID=103733 RepID=A0A5Q0H370_SACSY|nr:MFS transporter [Saccharothrix syringae]QFZ20707.1 MFS transporter [Saccharothrix syringae]